MSNYHSERGRKTVVIPPLSAEKNDRLFESYELDTHRPIRLVYAGTTSDVHRPTNQWKDRMKPGKYTVITKFEDVKVKNKITVKTTLITKNKSKKVKKSAKFKIKVLNSKGKAYKNQLVKVKFKGKTYKLKTNKKGIAIFKIPKKLKVGKYKIKTTYKGLTNSNRIIVRK